MGKKQLPEDFKDFIQLLNKNNVRYLLVGGWAVAAHGHPRTTKDIDFLISVEKNNIVKLKKALYEFGAPPINFEDFNKEGSFIKMGIEPIRIDIIKEASGIDLDDCYIRKKIMKIEGIKIKVISLEDLIINKKASGRSQDIADAEKLEKLNFDKIR